MKNAQLLSIKLLVAGSAFLSVACSAANGDESQQDSLSRHVKLVKAIEAPNTGKPAEIFHNSESGNSSTLLNAAILLRDMELPGIPGTVANSYGFSAGLKKNTLNGKRVDIVNGGGSLYSIWSFSADKQSSLTTSLDFIFSDDREHDARGRSVLLNTTLTAPYLHHDPNLFPKKAGVDAWLFPALGVYKHRISSSADPSEAPVGSYGGAYLSLNFIARLYVLTGDTQPSLFDRVSFQATAVVARESSVSGGYSKDTYRHLDSSIDFLLFGNPKTKGWKPSVGISRTTGTNRPANEPRQNTTGVYFKVSYGI